MALWVADCTPLTADAAIQSALPHLDAARRVAVTRRQDTLTRAQTAAAGLLLTHCFGQAGQPPILAHGSHGKPYLPDGRAHFSLSHSGRYAFLLTADSPVGLDAQQIDSSRPRVAARCFTAAEQVWLAQDPDGRFARLWAMKEAYLKFTGFGLVLPMRSFTVPLPPVGFDAATGCYWQELCYDGVAVAACGDRPLPPLTPQEWSIPALLSHWGAEL
mgnify:CR=1 FL=1